MDYRKHHDICAAIIDHYTRGYLAYTCTPFAIVGSWATAPIGLLETLRDVLEREIDSNGKPLHGRDSVRAIEAAENAVLTAATEVTP